MADALQPRDVAPPPSALDYAPPAPAARRFDGFALATHLAGWFLTLLLALGVSVFIVPRFEQFYRDFKAGIPEPTKLLLQVARELGDTRPLLVIATLCLLHSLSAAYWYRRATPAQKLAYRLVLFLLIAFAIGFVFVGLCEPLSRAMPGISGGVAPATSAPATSPTGN